VMRKRRPHRTRLQDRHMPIISAFFGIVIRMFYREHEPAHFHAETPAIERNSTSPGHWWRVK